jgi:hypothetical protein
VRRASRTRLGSRHTQRAPPAASHSERGPDGSHEARARAPAAADRARLRPVLHGRRRRVHPPAGRDVAPRRGRERRAPRSARRRPVAPRRRRRPRLDGRGRARGPGRHGRRPARRPERVVAHGPHAHLGRIRRLPRAAGDHAPGTAAHRRGRVRPHERRGGRRLLGHPGLPVRGPRARVRLAARRDARLLAERRGPARRPAHHRHRTRAPCRAAGQRARGPAPPGRAPAARHRARDPHPPRALGRRRHPAGHAPAGGG